MRARDWVIAVSLLVAVALSILWMGGVLRTAQALVAAVVAMGVGATALSQRGFSRVSPLVALIAAAAALTALQLLPLGRAIGDRVTPTTSSLRSDGADLLGTSPWTGASSDAAATLGALIVFLALLGIAMLALRIATSERGRYRLVAGVAVLCGVTAIVHGVHTLFELDAVYGIYKPQDAHPQVFGPVLNNNTLACLMAAGACLGIALAAHRKQPGWLRAMWLLLVPLCGAIVVATVSRGGTIALVAGAFITVGTLVAQRLTGADRSRKRRARFLSSALPIGILAGCVTVLVIWSNATNVERQFSQLSLDEVHFSRSKFVAWRSAGQLIHENVWLGVGRGAFEAPFTRVHEASGLATYPYLENEYLQAVVDFGVPGALILAAIAFWFVWLAIRRWRDNALSAGVLGALTVVAAQSNVDFGLEFLGLAAPVTALAATVLYVPLREAVRPRLARGLRVVHAVALLAGAALLMSSVTTTLDEDRQDLSKHATMALVRESATRHPLDYYAYAVGAELLAAKKDPRAIRLLNHAMALHPTHPQLHRMAGRMLLADKFNSQAAIEYAAALRMTEQPKPLLSEILEKFPGETAASALPLEYSDLRLVVTTLEDLKRADVARIWLARVLDVRPKTAQPCELMFMLAEHGDLLAADIAGRRCSDRLPDFQARAGLAKMLVEKKAYREAIQLLTDVESWQARRDEKIDAWLVMCDAERDLGQLDEAKRCLRRLDASPDMRNERRGEILTRIETINRAKAPPLPGTIPATGSAATP
ncbi:MAG TPA: O-antigen ligase family protein [Kofleriaceae bacterium]|nr:O-antigen ligase family protein [Kofleriaceae bacterium]